MQFTHLHFHVLCFFLCFLNKAKSFLIILIRDPTTNNTSKRKTQFRRIIDYQKKKKKKKRKTFYFSSLGFFKERLFLRNQTAPHLLQLRRQRDDVPPETLFLLVQIFQKRIHNGFVGKRHLVVWLVSHPKSTP